MSSAGPGDDPLGCRLDLIEYPETMRAGRDHTVLLSIRNLSPRVLYPRSVSLHDGNVGLSYHWYREPGEVYDWDHARIDVPKRLSSGESVTAYIRVRTPSEPGRYRLQPDMVEESVAWASSSVTMPTYGIEVL